MGPSELTRDGKQQLIRALARDIVRDCIMVGSPVSWATAKLAASKCIEESLKPRTPPLTPHNIWMAMLGHCLGK